MWAKGMHRLWKKLLEKQKTMTRCDVKTESSRLCMLQSERVPKAGDIVCTDTISSAITENPDDQDESGLPLMQQVTCSGVS